MFWWIFLFLLVLAIFLFYKYATRNENYFLDRNVAFIKPVFFIGSAAPVVFGQESFPDYHTRIHLEFWPRKIVGSFGLGKTSYIACSPDLVKQISIKEFASFTGHPAVFEVDELLSKVLSMLKKEKWRKMRATLSPAFTGNKIRIMHDLIKNCCTNAICTLNERIKDKETFEMKEFFTNFAVDVIASCAFGLDDVDSFKNPDNEFKKIALMTLNPPMGVKEFFLAIFLVAFPKLVKKLNIQLLDKHVAQFFRTTILETVKFREENQIFRPDMIHLLMEARKWKLRVEEDERENDKTGGDEEKEMEHEKEEDKATLTDDDLVAQCILFFSAGLETVSSALAFASYELAVNPGIQEKLRSEIIECEKSSNHSLSYDKMQKMNYMDNFVTEVLRKWPPAVFSQRLCDKNCTVKIEDGKLLEIEKDQIVVFPIYAFHHNPEFFPDPDKFDPDRFKVENRDQQDLTAFMMPFGLGLFEIS